MREKTIAMLLVVSMMLSLFAGCATTNPTVDPTGTSENTATTATEGSVAANTSEPTTAPTETEATEAPTEPPTAPPTEPTEPEPLFTVEQQNSINMMNYLAALVTEINASSGSRVYLEEVYLDLLNNTDPSKVDAFTLQQYNGILDLLEGYRMIDVKRERLNYLYDQNRAAALRSAMPSPMSMLNVVQSENALKAVVSLLYLAVDSVNSYSSHTSSLDAQYLQDNWNLKDQEAQYLHNSRTDMFNYLVRITGNYDIPGVISLNEEYATEFVKWKNDSNVPQRIRWLEDKADTYRYFGEYWLALAESYYLNNDPQKCLDAIAEYESLNISIYRIDYKYAEVLPYIILSAKETMDSPEYIEFAAKYAELIMSNASWYDWAKQYYVCQTYMDLYTISKDTTYLQRAYDIALNTTAYLVEEQEALNEEYLKKLEEKKADKDASEKVKQEIEEYNEYIEYLNEIRKTELPPVYEPLRLFCELLFGLADELNISADNQRYAENILREHDEKGRHGPIFLDRTLDNLYRFELADYVFSADDIAIEFDGKRITIPAQYVSSSSYVVLTVDGHVIADWQVKNVDRKKSENFEDFIVTFISKEVRELEFEDGAVVTIKVFPYDSADESLIFSFDVEKGFLNLSTIFVRSDS